MMLKLLHVLQTADRIVNKEAGVAVRWSSFLSWRTLMSAGLDEHDAEADSKNSGESTVRMLLHLITQ